MPELMQCNICGKLYAGKVDGDCGANDEQHRKARGQS